MITHRGVSIFAKGFNDQILKPTRSLDMLYGYLRDNPRRLAVRREHPEYFRRVNRLKIGDKTYQAYGNIQLLDCPFKEAVVIHRARIFAPNNNLTLFRNMQ